MDPALDDPDHDDPDQDFATVVDPGPLEPEEESQLPASKRFVFSRSLPSAQTKPTIELDIGDKFMLAKAKSEVPTVLAQIAADWGMTVPQLSVTAHSQMLHNWSASILTELRGIVNSSIALEKDRVSERDMHQWMTVLMILLSLSRHFAHIASSIMQTEMVLAVYGVSPEALFNHGQPIYPLVRFCCSPAIYQRVLGALKCTTSGTKHADRWEPPMQFEKRVSRLLDVARDTFRVGFVERDTILSCDDDLVRLSSKTVENYGFAQKNNPVKGYVSIQGVQQDGAVSAVTGIVVSLHIPGQGESSVSSLKIMQRSLAHCNSDELIHLEALYAFDRGYMSAALQEQIIKTGGDFIGTVKRGAGMPFTFGDGTKSRKEWQEPVQESGTMMDYYAMSQGPNSKSVYWLGWRGGMGDVGLGCTTLVPLASKLSYIRPVSALLKVALATPVSSAAPATPATPAPPAAPAAPATPAPPTTPAPPATLAAPAAPTTRAVPGTKAHRRR
ncbi:hypothetical protein HDU98_003375 [Podochytrium sp. JEL0797]|nr:hypothetical protein HDU98_003375 [Podochytrium sp. JEL0797]